MAKSHSTQGRHASYPPASPADAPSRPERMLAGIAALMLLLRIIAGFLPATSITVFWGITPLMMNTWDTLLLFALPLLLLVPGIRRTCATAVEQPRTRAQYLGASAVLIIVAVVAAWNIHVLFPFLGDGSSYLAEVIRIRASEAYQSFLLKPTAWLSGELIHMLARATSSPDVAQPYTITGILALITLLGGGVVLLRDEAPAPRLLLFTLVFFSSASLLFFGYVELYAMQVAFTALFLLSAWTTLRTGRSPVTPGILLLIAMAWGAAAAILLPAFLHLLLDRRGWVKRFRSIHIVLAGALLMGIAVSAAHAISGFDHPGQYLHPLLTSTLDIDGRQINTITYTVFSLPHLWDVLQVYILNAGLPLLLLLITVLSLPSPGRDTSSTTFFALASIGGLFMVLFGNSMFGLARDWDLAVVATLPVAFLAASVLVSRLEAARMRPGGIAVWTGALALALWWPWMAVNMSPASATRFEQLLDARSGMVNVRWTWNGLENLRKYHVSRSDAAGCKRILFRMLDTRFNTLDTHEKIFDLMLNTADNGAMSDALLASLMREARDPFPANDTRHISPPVLRQKTASFILDAIQTGTISRDDARIGELGAAFGEWRERGIIDAVLDTTLTPAERLQRAQAALPDTLHDGLLAGILGQFHMQTGDFPGAASALQRAIELDPGRYPEMYLTLSSVLDAELRDHAAARSVLERGLVDCRLSPRRGEIEAALKELR